MITLARVRIGVECVADDVDFALRPWKTKAKRATTIRFTLTGVSRAEVYAKDPAKWPFVAPSPLVISGASSDFAIRTDAVSQPYAYGVRFDCGAAGGALDIDPDIIIVD